MSESGSVPPGWYPDPRQRFDHRYWDGTAWTDQVSRAGVTATDALDAPTPAVGEPVQPSPRVPEPEPRPKKPWWVGIPIRGWVILALIPIGLIVGVVAAVTNPNDDDKPVWDASLAYEGCKQAIENRGGSAPDLLGDFGVSLDSHVGKTYEFTVNHRYTCRVTRLPDGRIDVATSGG